MTIIINVKDAKKSRPYAKIIIIYNTQTLKDILMIENCEYSK